jgi:hypothetical protein
MIQKGTEGHGDAQSFFGGQSQRPVAASLRFMMFLPD